jgi:predicted Holliday junction resolvase-like endonuclease
MVNKARIPQTKEQIEYEEAKKNFRIATAKTRLYSGGVDPSKVSQQALDKVLRIFDDMDNVQQDTQQKTSRIQQEADAKIQKLNQDANKKFGEIQTKYQDLMNSLKGDNKEEVVKADIADIETQAQTDVQAESAKEEVIERTREDLVGEITEKVLEAFIPFMKGPVAEKVNEFMSTIDKKTSDTVVKSSVKDMGKNTPTEESGKVVSSEELRQAIYKDIL